MRLERQVNIGKGKIIKDDFINIFKSIEMQNENLYEDMFQMVSFDQKFIMDIGWYDGEMLGFHICIIENENWEKPILKLVSKDIASFLINFKKANEKWEELVL